LALSTKWFWEAHSLQAAKEFGVYLIFGWQLSWAARHIGATSSWWHVILGGAALQRCENRSVLRGGFSR
jgi:hypothetical protein